MYRYKLEEIEFEDGTRISMGPLTVLVGPNNAGKTRALRDIVTLATATQHRRAVVTDIKFPIPANIEDLLESYKVEIFTQTDGSVYLRGLASTLKTQHNLHVGTEWRQILSNSIKTQDEDS